MKPTALLRAMTVCALIAAPIVHAHQVQERPPTAQQVQKAQQDRSAAEHYLQHEEAAATGDRSGVAGGAASVADEAGGAPGDPRRAGPAGSTGGSGNGSTRAGASAPAPAYGPVLGPQPAQQVDPARKTPTDVHDETDRLQRDPAATPAQRPAQQPSQRQQKQSRRNAARHAAWQPADEPMAPRPLRSPAVAVSTTPPVPLAPPAAAPQALVPSSTQLNGCRGGACLDANGATVNGIGSGNAGVSNTGRLCSRTGATVQCF